MEKAAYNARQELKYMKFLEAERLYVILAETYLLNVDIDKSLKSYMRAVESVESLIYFKDVSTNEIPDAIERCTNYHSICGKIEAARQNYFLSTEHFYNAGGSAMSVQKYESALKYYQKALDCTSRTPIPMENWDIQRREVYKDIILAMEDVKKHIKR
jgi:tetratricopeptide (TPR) repeat protein